MKVLKNEMIFCFDGVAAWNGANPVEDETQQKSLKNDDLQKLIEAYFTDNVWPKKSDRLQENILHQR